METFAQQESVLGPLCPKGSLLGPFIPQGSVLGQLLFAIYCNDLEENIGGNFASST